MTVFTATLVARHSGKVASVNQESLENGAEVVQWTFVGGDHQKWTLEGVAGLAGGYYIIRNVHSGKVLSVYGEQTGNGVKLVQWTDTDKAHQQFSLG